MILSQFQQTGTWMQIYYYHSTIIMTINFIFLLINSRLCLKITANITVTGNYLSQLLTNQGNFYTELF